MRHLTRRGVNALLLGLPLVPAFAPSQAWAIPTQPAVDRDTLVVALEKEIQNLDALITASGDSLRYAWQIYDTLYGFDSKGNMVPRMATSYEVSPDGLSYTYRLRPGILFHNGDPLTSADVAFSVERVLDPAAKSTRRPFFAPIMAGVDTPDPQTVIFRLKQPDGAFLNKIAGFLFIVPKGYISSLPTSEAFAIAPIGSGPYKVVRHDVGQSLELERFDGFYGTKPGIKRLIMKMISEGSTRVNALLTGEVDIAVQVPVNQKDRLQAEPGVKVVVNPVSAPMHVRLYSNDPSLPVSKRDVRLALNHGLDSAAIIRSVYHGVGQPMGTFISAFYPYGSDPSIKPFAYDPAKAKALLKQAGYPNGFETKLYSANDHPKELAEAIAAYWSQIGVKTEILRIDYAAWSRLNNTHKTGPMTITQFTNAIYDPIHPVAGSFSKEGTWSNYYNPQVEALIDQLNGAVGPEKRGALFRQIGQILHDDAAAVYITELFYVFAYKAPLAWEVQEGSGFLNFRNVSWT
ncbi:ABC transporter substrate-binding protein [Xanthobacter sp. DSM 24535]|uniref:ABC transporter substrate-binding protein n=1 Tax=Roseixanthobacter psychrophilus TaxID=3119917 RepID=UPI003728DC57